MKKFILPVALSSLLLTACSAEWKSERDLGDEAFEKGNFESALKHYETSLEMKETDTTKEKIKETSERIEKIKAEEAKKEKKLAEEEKQLEYQETLKGFTQSFDESTVEGFLRLKMFEVLNDGFSAPNEISQHVILDSSLGWGIEAVGKGKDAITEKDILEGYFEDITKILADFKDTGFKDYDSIMIILNSKFGTTLEDAKKDWAIKIGMNESTINNINFDEFNYLDLPEVADAYLLHPSLNPRFK